MNTTKALLALGRAAAAVSGVGAERDEHAVTATKQRQFEPGTKEGKPVSVRVDVKMRLTLR